MTIIKVRFAQEGFHQWPKAPADRDYLSARHRHLFHFQCEMEITADRQVEFHDFLTLCKTLVISHWLDKGDTCEFDDASCEAIATWLLNQIANSYDNYFKSGSPPWLPFIAVEVWEDGECGARVERD